MAMAVKRQHEEVEEDVLSEDEELDQDDEILADVKSRQREVTGEPMKKLTKKEKEKLYREPTVEELNQMRETENLFHSNLFRLQIIEVLKEVSLKEKHKKQTNKLVNELKEVITELPASPKYELNDTKWLLKHGIKVPLHQPCNDIKGQFQFLPPCSVQVVGSYLLDTVVKPDCFVDLMVEMPQDCVNKEDNMNHKLLRKRALYLAYIASQLKLVSFCEDLHFTYHYGNHLKPILNLKLKGESRTVSVNVIVVLPKDVFKPELFSVKKCNVNVKWWKKIVQSESKDDITLKPTPVSNMAVLEDLTLTQNMDNVQTTLAELPGFADGIKLLKIWLRQRELDKGYGYFNGYIITMYVLYLLNQRLLNKTMSSYQVFRSTLIHLARNDWGVKTPFLYKQKKNNVVIQTDSVSDMKSVFDVVFVDVTGCYNICYNVNKTVYKRVLHEAKLSADYLTGHATESFDLLLMTPVPFDRKYDYCFHIDNIDKLSEVKDKFGEEEKLVDNGGHSLHAYLTSILNILCKALDRRVLLLQPHSLPIPQWSIDCKPSTSNDIKSITIGLLVDTLISIRAVEKGPSADSSEAREFREFWGEMSELRRFQDGSICEAIVWSKGSTFRKKRLVISKIIPYILNKYAGIDPEDIRFIGEEFDIPLHLPFPRQPDKAVYGTGEEQHMTVIHTFDSVKKTLRSLTEMPLRINNIHGTHPVFRFTDVFPAMALNQFKQTKVVDSCYYPTRSNTAPPHQPTLAITCLLEGSGRWPEEIEAVKRLKAAIYIKMEKGLSADKTLKIILQPTYIDIMKNGFVFRVKIYALRELSILKSSVSKSGVLCIQNTEKSYEFEKDVIALPKLSSTIHGIYQQHNTLSCAIRLAKRWIASQLLTSHIPDIAVELIVCHLYISPAPYTKPGSPGSGFLRFLQFISSFDWKNSPLLINLNDEFTPEDYVEIPARFQKERELFPLMFLSTPGDRWSNYWTKDRPTAMILNRLAILARESLNILQKQVLSPQPEDDIKEVFRPPLESYDIVIYLKSSLLPRNHQAVDLPKSGTMPELRTDEDKAFPLIDYNTAMLYIQELEEMYKDKAMFFYDQYGGSCIGVLWKPRLFQKRDFKVPNLIMSKPSTRGNDLVLEFNMEAVVEDFKILGAGLVDRVVVRTDTNASS